MKTILGKKIGMTQIYDETGNVVPVSVIEAGPCRVTQVKTEASDGYNAIQVGFYKTLREIRVEQPADFQVGQEIKTGIFETGDVVAVSGVSIGKGFAGTVKRHHFHRGPMSHGSKSHRLPGSIGAGTTPGRVLKGRRMSGRLGGVKVTNPGLKVINVEAEKNLILVRGSVPGKPGGLVMIEAKGKK